MRERPVLEKSREGLMRDLRNWKIDMLDEDSFEKLVRERAEYIKMKEELKHETKDIQPL